MRHFKIMYLISYVIIRPWEVTTITTRLDRRHLDFRRHTSSPPFSNWELGLRESVHQALLREHHSDPNLREQLLEAPLIGRQNTPTPFGDIAVLARGQLYITPEGYKFVQDSNGDECIDCYYKEKCIISTKCQLWETGSHHLKLLALWTVKRIRHRDPHYGHVFEIEYTISPITSAINEELVRRHGYFNYNVPGHIFIIKSNPETSAGYYLNSNSDKWYKNQATQYPIDQKQDFRDLGSGHFKHGIVIGVGHDGYKHVLHTYPGFYSSYHPQNNDQTTIDPKEYELYKKLIESLASKTSKLPHRFSVTTATKKTTSTNKPGFQLSTFVPVPQTTYVQSSDGQLLPMEEKTVRPTTTQMVTSATFPLKTETYQITKYSEPDLLYHTLQMPTEVPTLQPARPIAIPMTTIHYFTPVDKRNETTTTTTITTSEKMPSVTSIITTKPTVQQIHIYDIFSPTERFPPQKTTKQMTTEAEQRDLVTIITSTEPMTPTTEHPAKTSPTFINEQLPPPSKTAEITEPYIFTVTTQASIMKKENKTFTNPFKEKITTVSQLITSTFIPTIRDEVTTFIEKTPYSEQKTTVILPVPTTQEGSSTSTVKHVESSTTGMFTTATTAVPISSKTSTEFGSTLLENVSFTTTNREMTPTFTIFAETNPSTHFIQTTNQQTTPNTESPATFKYDSTSKNNFETAQTATNGSSYYPTISNIPTFTNPMTTTLYFNTFDTDIPKSTVFTTEKPTLDRTDEVTLTTPNVIRETTSKEQLDTITISTEKTISGTEIQLNISSNTDDFLIDDENKNYKKKITNDKKDFNEDDIFGKPQAKVSTEVPQTTSKRSVTQSDVAQALFGGRRSKRIKVASKIKRKPGTTKPKIIYNNFYTASIPSFNSAATVNNYIPKTSTTTEYWLSTDQSLSTSISFKVNKEKRKMPTTLQLKSSIKENSKSKTKEVFDDFALKLVNHARTIDIMISKTTKKPKHRRSFSVKRGSQRRSNNINNKKKTESK